jgi:Tol biopolymer transport system component/DNA-binding winged helix-turn-helix (wHTH) protein
MSQQTNGIYEFGSFRLDAQERLLQRNGVTISLTPKAFDLLLALVERHGRLVEKEELFQTVWPDTIVEESNLTYNISHIRKALGDGENGQKFIETVPKRGYRFAAPVREISRAVAGDLSEAASPASAVPAENVRPSERRRRWPLMLMVAGALIVVASGAVWWIAFRHAPVLPAPKITPFTTLPGNESKPSFSPDGNQMAFVWGGEKGENFDIYVKQIGNESLHRLTNDTAIDAAPRWSPDGRYIAFTRQNGLYLISPLGGAERKIATLSSPFSLLFAGDPDWSPDGEWLAVSSWNPPQEPETLSLFLVERETGEKKKLTSPQAGTRGDRFPAFSPDGKTLAFFRFISDAVGDLYLVSVAGGEPKRMTFDDAGAIYPTWTPDGRDILFLSTRDGASTAGLWRIPATGGAPEKVETIGQRIGDIAISPQGNRMAWTQGTNDFNIWQYDLTGPATQRPQELIASTQYDVSPQYSPDGKRVVFASDRSGSWEIWVCDSAGKRPLQLTAFKRRYTGSPRWSSDGRQIVFDSRAEGNAEIYVISAEGGKPRRLTNDPAEDIVPSFSRDGKWIYFCSNRSGSLQIWKLPVAGGQAAQVTKQGGFDSFEAPDGQWLYYAKGRGAAGIWRMPVAGGEETLALDHHRAGFWRYWAVTEKGIYFTTAETPDHPLIEFFNFATGKVTTITTLEKRIDGNVSGLSVSPDGRALIWSQQDQTGSDIMLMENFR